MYIVVLTWSAGMGATLAWTQETIAALHVIITQLKHDLGLTRVRLLDIPCGDMAWMSRFLKTRDDVDYVGVDIVDSLIDHHRKAFTGYGWKFYRQDILEDGMVDDDSGKAFDIILCRTLLQHLYFYDISQILRTFSRSGARLLLTTSWYGHDDNKDLEISNENPGRFRRLNLELPPVSLVPPMCLHRDGPPDAYEGWDHFLGLWALPLRRHRRCDAATSFTLAGTDKKIFSCVNWSLKH